MFCKVYPTFVDIVPSFIIKLQKMDVTDTLDSKIKGKIYWLSEIIQ